MSGEATPSQARSTALGVRGAAAVCAVAALLAAGPAMAGRDYDPESDDWNGLGRLSDIAAEQGVGLVVPRLLDWDSLSPETGVLIVYPTTRVSRDGLIAHLRRGGRALVADDFGAADEVLGPLGVDRVDLPVSGGLHFREAEHLPVAAPVDEGHVLAQGVRRVVANHPSTFVSDLPPVFVTGEPPRTLVAVGAVGDGRLVLLGDPSVLINNMLELRGNERFARNLLAYLAGAGDGPRTLQLVTGRFPQRAGGETVSGAAAAARQQLNASLLRLSDHLRPRPEQSSPLWLLVVAALVVTVAVATLVVRVGPRPRLYGGLWLKPIQRPRAAGFVGTVEYLEGADATHLYPLLILKRELEARLLDGLGLPAPSKLDVVLKAYSQVVPSATKPKALERLLVRLGGVASAAMASGSGLRVSKRELQRTIDIARELLRPLGKDIDDFAVGPRRTKNGEGRRSDESEGRR